MRFPNLTAAFALTAFITGPVCAENWPEWRGPGGAGITSETNLPLKWTATEGVRWKVPLPERGNSTPVVWGDRIFLTQAVGSQRLLFCFDRKDGRVLWKSGPTFQEPERTHPTNPYASASPVTDGERVVAWFGSAGIYCFDLEGKELWKKDLGRVDHEWGYAASPVIHDGMVFLNFGPGDRAAIVALDKLTGEKRWQEDLPPKHPEKRTDGFAGKNGAIGSWATPLIVKTGERSELVMTVPDMVRAFDPSTGKELWRCGGLNPLIYTSTMFGEGVVVSSGGYGGSTVAVRPGGSGDVTESHRAWYMPRDKQRIGSGVFTGGHLYILNTPGTAQCIDVKTGKPVWEQRLQGPSGRSESWSSMVLSGDRIYVTNQGSDCFVLKASPTFEILATNALEDGLCNSSVVPSNGDLFIRTHKHLWCIGGSAGGPAGN